jgi:hypothetical protein
MQTLIVNFQKNFQYFAKGVLYHQFYFNIFFIELFDKYKKYGVITERKKSVVVVYFLMILFLFTPTKSFLKNYLYKAHV